MTPKLASLSPEQRRVLAAELLGWKFSANGKTCGIGHPDCISVSYAFETAIPDPDEDANGALLLVEHLRIKDEWGFELTRFNDEKLFTARFTHLIYDAHSARADTAPMAITSAALLASGAATE